MAALKIRRQQKVSLSFFPTCENCHGYVVMKTLRRILSLSLILLFISGLLPAQNQYRVVGYYAMWTRAAFPASSMKFNYLTHINHAFAWPNADGSIAAYDTPDIELITATHKANRKILILLGGASESGNFSLVAANPATRQTFVKNIVAYLTNNGYDGTDFDWEVPQNAADRTNEIALLKETRESFRKADSTWLLTMAIDVSDWSGQWHDFGALAEYVDWFNAMTYDYHGSWSSHAGHNAPLYLGSDPINDYSVDQSVQYLTVTRAIPKAKLVLGLPFYAKSFGTSTLYTSYTGESDLAYRNVVSAIQIGGWDYHLDNASKVPYYTLASPPTLISYDDSTSLSIKCQYVKNNGLSGVMIWELSQDVTAQGQPLLEAIEAVMNTAPRVTTPQRNSDIKDFAFYDNYPNPFNPSTTIRFALFERAHVSMTVFNVLGEEVATLVNELREPGSYSV
jgi:chitinase